MAKVVKKSVKKSVKRAENGRAVSDNTSVRKPVIKQTKQEAAKDKEWPWDIYKQTTIDNATGRRRQMTDSEHSKFAKRTIEDFEKKRNYPGSLWEKTKAKEKQIAASKKKMGGKVVAKKAKSVAKVIKKAASKKK